MYDVIKYIPDFQNATRNKPIKQELARQLNYGAAVAGVDRILINSGGQDAAGTPGARRTGSNRHDHGNAADFKMSKYGLDLDFTNPAHLPIFEAFIQGVVRAGATGVGAAVDYMGPNTIHVGGGLALAWGAGGRGATAPKWIKDAHARGMKQQASFRWEDDDVEEPSERIETHMSQRARQFLRDHEGDVLKAYRDVAGVLTIGVGLTAASGVVVPKIGMTITKEQSDSLLSEALSRNYEPAVRKALPNAPQHVFDGATSFHFNTGAIAKASWVNAYRNKLSGAAIKQLLSLWNKGGGRVLGGLVRRRKEEGDIIVDNKWPHSAPVIPADPIIIPPSTNYAIWYKRLTTTEKVSVKQALKDLGYNVGFEDVPHEIRLEAVTEFQRKYALTVDGKIGQATLTTIQREIDALRKGKQAGGGTAAGFGGSVAVGQTSDYGMYVGLGAGVVVLVVALYLAYRYRDVIAAKLNDKAPRLAEKLRSI